MNGKREYHSISLHNQGRRGRKSERKKDIMAETDVYIPLETMAS